MKKHQFAATAFLALAATISTAKPLMAQVIVGDYYEDRTSKTCTSTGCLSSYILTPANKFLNVQNVSCYISSSQPLRTAQFGASSSPGGQSARQTYINFQENPPSGNGIYYYNTSQPMFFKIAPSRYPYVFLGSSSNTPVEISMSCIFAGTLSDN